MKDSDLHIPIYKDLHEAFNITCDNLGFEKTKLITAFVMYLCEHQKPPRELVPYIYYLEIRGRRSRRKYAKEGRE